jgi:predicted N-formylglutamate amidohydrolase
MDDDWANEMSEAFEIVGMPQERGVLIVADHASNHVPDDIDLGLSSTFLTDHIAYDIGVAEIVRKMVETQGFLGIMGGVSRLVVDLNRYPDEEAVIPQRSDGVEISNNHLNQIGRARRIERYFTPYHNRVAKLIADLHPRLVLALHSFSPILRSNPQVERPWDVGVMYNEHKSTPSLALHFLSQEDLLVGNQKPYSGEKLNATMNRQAEAIGQPYFGMEIRQDLIVDEVGQQHFSEILQRLCEKVLTGLV